MHRLTSTHGHGSGSAAHGLQLRTLAAAHRMGAKFPNPRRIRIHRSHSIEEIASTLEVHKHTVRRWQSLGLQAIDNAKPRLFRGTEIRRFLSERRRRARQPCAPGQMYCLRCRAPRTPSGNCADLLPRSATLANLCGLCGCGTLMYRRVSHRTLERARGNLTLSIPQEGQRIGESENPSPNADLIEMWEGYAKQERK
jgi:hypothetical protein